MSVDNCNDLDVSLEILRSGKGSERQEAWLRVRDALRSDPATVAPRVGAIVDDLLQHGHAGELAGSMLFVLWACTGDVPDAISTELPRRVLMHPDGIDPYVVTAAAAMLTRHGTDGLVADGLPMVLQVSNAVLEACQPGGEERRLLDRMVREVWSNVAFRDPTLLADILAAWVQRTGAYTPLAGLCIELLAQAAPQHPGLADGVLDIAHTVVTPEELISMLEHVRFAERLVASFDSADFRGRPTYESAAPRTPADPEIDRILELFCDPDPERAQTGWSRIVDASPSKGLFQRLGEALVELAEHRPQDARIGAGLCVIHSRARERPDVVPAEEIDRLLNHGGLGEHDRTVALGALAMSKPERVVDRHLKSAIVLSAKGGSFAKTLWQALGRAFPGLLMQSARAVFGQGGFGSSLGDVLAAAFEPTARARPDQLDGLLAVLREESARQRDPVSAPGLFRIALRPSVDDLIERLEQGRQGAPS
jgi:hypothetical protein